MILEDRSNLTRSKPSVVIALSDLAANIQSKLTGYTDKARGRATYSTLLLPEQQFLCSLAFDFSPNGRCSFAGQHRYLFVIWHAVFGTDIQTRFSRTARLTHDPSEIRFSVFLNHTADTARVSASFVRDVRPSRVAQLVYGFAAMNTLQFLYGRDTRVHTYAQTHTNTHTHIF